MLQSAMEAIIRAKSFVLPELNLSFYSDKEPVLLSAAKRIAVEDCRVASGALRLLAGGKPLLVAVNPDDALTKQLENGDVSALMVALDPMGDMEEQLVEGALNKAWLYNQYAHKIFSRFLQASDRLRVIAHGERYHVQDCPVQARVYRGRPYANREQDCMSCMFCIDTSEADCVLCTGRSRLAVPEDFALSLEARKEQYDEFLQPDKTGLVAQGICPHCGGALTEKSGEQGSFLGCSHYPFCHFTAERQKDGLISFHY